jgi:hypothetical protein
MRRIMSDASRPALGCSFAASTVFGGAWDKAICARPNWAEHSGRLGYELSRIAQDVSKRTFEQKKQ